MSDPSTNPETTPLPKAWTDRIDPFALAVNKAASEITEALKVIVGEPSEDAALALADAQLAPEADIATVLVASGPKIPLIIFRKHLPKLRGVQAQLVANSDMPERSPSANWDLLPQVPEDTNFLELLKVGGVLKVGTTEVMSAMKAAIASSAGLYDLPEMIQARMEAFANEQEEPVGREYFALQKLVTTRSYGDILSVLDVPGSFVTERRKKEFLAKLDTELWPALSGFYALLASWYDMWVKSTSNPAAVMSLLIAGQQGQGAVLPGGVNQAPDTSGLRDEAEVVVNRINRIFAGVGIPVARALAYDATRIKAILEEPGLPALMGAANKDQMLKTLGVAVGSDLIRLDRNITRFTLGVMELPNAASGNSELSYLNALVQLGAAIHWDRLPEMLHGSGTTSTRPRPR